jgi:phage terminase small subunit
MADQEQLPAEEKEKKLTGKELLFCNEYLTDLNGTRAYMSAGYKPKNSNVAAVQAGKLLRNAHVRAYIDKRLLTLRNNLEITQERVLKEYSRICFSDPRKAFNEKGMLKNIHDFDDDTAAAIASVESEELFEGRGKDREHIGTLRKIKFWDKRGALQDMRTHVRLLVEPAGGANDRVIPVIFLPNKLEINNTQIVIHAPTNGGNGKSNGDAPH